MKKKKQNDEAPLPAREAALRILERTGISAPVQSLLDTKLTGGLFSRQEAALTTELVYGYLRSEIRISWLLSQFMKAPEKLPASMKLMIGIAAYELLYLDRIPAHASVSAAVDAVRARFRARAVPRRQRRTPVPYPPLRIRRFESLRLL